MVHLGPPIAAVCGPQVPQVVPPDVSPGGPCTATITGPGPFIFIAAIHGPIYCCHMWSYQTFPGPCTATISIPWGLGRTMHGNYNWCHKWSYYRFSLGETCGATSGPTIAYTSDLHSKSKCQIQHLSSKLPRRVNPQHDQ